MGLLGLPALPPDLKPMSAYLQRSEELRDKDPIMAYWCAYYAAQVGISLKTKDPNARKILFELLGLLEQMKKEIGSSDAIENETASCAYVENFALRIFSIADNEDRKGSATMGTAKKFLAAANFLEILSVFDQSETASASSPTPSDTTTLERIRYAKWKAVEIAKAFREGRKPTPGPAGGLDNEPELPTVIPAGEEPFVSITASTPPPSIPSFPSTHNPSPPATEHNIAPPPHLTELPSTPQSGHVYLHPSLQSSTTEPPISPGQWSTTANTGEDTPQPDTIDETPPMHPRKAWLSEELEGKDPEEYEIIEPPPQDPSFTDTPSTSAIPFSRSITDASTKATEGDPDEIPSIELPVDATSVLPTVPIHPTESSTPLSPPPPPTFTPSPSIPTFPNIPGAPSYPPGFIPSAPHPTAPPLPPSIPQSPHLPSYRPVPPSIPQPLPVVAPLPPTEMTPQMIAKTQKHCRWAISALDYEDLEKARSELREALAMLGG